MLLRHSFYYLLARGLPGLLNFAALALYTRLLSPDEFGRYALIIAGVGLAEALLFQWLRLVLGRYLPAHQDDPARLLAGVAALFLVLAVLVTGLGSMLALLWPDPIWQRLLALAIPLLLAQAGSEFTLTIARANLAPARYGLLSGSRAGLALLMGGGLAWVGLGAQAPIAGLLIGHVLAIGLFGMTLWKGAWPRWPQAEVLQEQLRYGLPLIATFALTWVIHSSDRFLLGWLLGQAEVGLYTVGYDLAQHSLGLLLTIINTAAFPLVVHALETQGTETARTQLAENGSLVACVALAGAAGMTALAPEIIQLVVGEGFRNGARQVLPWIALSAAIGGIKSFHFDLAFHLGTKSRFLVTINLLAAAVNIVLNLILIPSHGIVGAAWATIAAYGVAVVSSAWLGRQAFDMPAAPPILLPPLWVAGATGAAAWLGSQWFVTPLASLAAGLLLGGGAAALSALILNLAGARTALLQRCS